MCQDRIEIKANHIKQDPQTNSNAKSSGLLHSTSFSGQNDAAGLRCEAYLYISELEVRIPCMFIDKGGS